MDHMTKVPCTISIDKELLKKLDEHRKSLGETRSVVIQRFVRESLGKAPKPKEGK